MGVDVPDVERVIHVGTPTNLECKHLVKINVAT